jgi:hypothetical protein
MLRNLWSRRLALAGVAICLGVVHGHASAQTEMLKPKSSQGGAVAEQQQAEQATGAAQPSPSQVQEWSGNEGSTTFGPSLEQYLKEAGPDATVIQHGALKIGGHSVTCGNRPTVMNSNFVSWGGAFPGFVILNAKKIQSLSTQVKLFVYSHECGHQYVGANENKADLFAIRRGVKGGWLDARGMEDICTFVSHIKGDSVHAPGPDRCETMRSYYRQLVGTDTYSGFFRW